MKYIFIDWNYFQYRAIFSWYKEQRTTSTWKALNFIVAGLREVKVEREDIVILARDGRNSWRKDFSEEYKSNRKEKREQYPIDWEDQYRQFDYLLKNIDESLNWHEIILDKLEADDIIAVGCKKFQDHKCIVVSVDSDFDQLAVYPNVKIYSPLSKKFKVIKNPYKCIADKIKQERTDNLLSPILNQQDFEKRNMLVNLLELPKEIEDKANEALDNLLPKTMDLSRLMYASLIDRISEMYDNSKQLTLV